MRRRAMHPRAVRPGKWVFGFLAIALATAGCGRALDRPNLQPPLKALPAGACMVVAATDLAKLWQRAERHKAAEVLGRLVPNAGWFQSADYKKLRAALEEFEASSGVELKRDLLLNVLGGRVVIGLYSDGSGGTSEMVLAAELANAGRYQDVVDAVLETQLGEGVRVEAATVAGRQALRVQTSSMHVLMMQKDGILVVATTEELALAAWRVIDAPASTSATSESQFVEALDQLGLHNVVVVEMADPAERIPWAAQGFTWQSDGLHFKRMVAVPEPEAKVDADHTPIRRDELLRSVPRGMTLAYYAQPSDADLVRDLLQGLGTCGGSNESSILKQSTYSPRPAPGTPGTATTVAGGRGAPQGGMRFAVVRQSSAPGNALFRTVATTDSPLGISSLPFNLDKDVLPWCGDELVFVLADLEKTGVIPIPAAALIIEVADAELAEQTLFDLESKLTDLPFEIGATGFVDVRYGGQTYRSFSQPFLESISPSWWTNGDIAVISTTRLLMQQIIDTRRVGKRHMLNDASFSKFDGFVPASARAMAYTDVRKLYRSLHQMAELPRMLSDEVDRGVRYVEGMSALFEHFPASVLYLDRQPHTLTLNVWLREDH